MPTREPSKKGHIGNERGRAGCGGPRARYRGSANLKVLSRLNHPGFYALRGFWEATG